MRAKKARFSYSVHERVREENREWIEKLQLLSQSMELGCSVFVDPRTKVHLRNESYTWVSETKDFSKDSSEEFGKSWISGLQDFQKLRLRSKS